MQTFIAESSARFRHRTATFRFALPFLMLAFALFVSTTGQSEAKRVALVVGNGAYSDNVALPNPVGDAKAIEAKLSALGFEVISGYDLTKAAMQATLARFAKAARDTDIALFFYAGHGLQVGGHNYLIPIDAELQDETSLDFEAVQVDFVLRQMERSSKVRIAILDACRDNPLAKTLARSMGATRSTAVGSGLAEINVGSGGEGTVIAFATSPGSVAYDGNSDHSPFTAALLKHIDAQDVNVQTMLTRVTGDVYRATAQRQRPWVNASLVSEVFLNSSKTTLTPTARAPVAVDVAELSTKRSSTLSSDRAEDEAPSAIGNVAALQEYLRKNPNGEYAEQAREKLGFATTSQAATPGVGNLLILPGEPSLVFDVPLKTGPHPVVGKSLKELAKGEPMFSPIEGLDPKVWKGKSCSNCHQWDKVTLCDQGSVYARSEPAHMLRKQHPYGGPFKLALRNWSEGGCR